MNRFGRPEVIQRISVLFRGHSELIEGFNTFLPPGHRIEISSDPRQDVITVTTPMDALTQMSDGSIGRLPQNPPSLQPPPIAAPSPIPSSNLQSLPANAPNLRPITPKSVTPARIPSPQQPPLPPLNAAVSILGNMSARANKDHLQSSSSNFHFVGGPGRAEEFNHTFRYLEKIRLRYSDDQVTYQTFLEILRTHQKEQRHPHDVRLVYHLVGLDPLISCVLESGLRPSAGFV